MEKFTDLPNIGKVNAQKLITSGIATVEDFLALGAKESFLKVRQAADPDACLHMLLALAGAERGIKKKDLPADVAADLKAFFNSITM